MGWKLEAPGIGSATRRREIGAWHMREGGARAGEIVELVVGQEDGKAVAAVARRPQAGEYAELLARLLDGVEIVDLEVAPPAVLLVDPFREGPRRVFRVGVAGAAPDAIEADHHYPRIPVISGEHLEQPVLLIGLGVVHREVRESGAEQRIERRRPQQPAGRGPDDRGIETGAPRERRKGIASIRRDRRPVEANAR